MSAGATALLPGGEDQTARPGAHLRISVVISAHALDRWHVLEMSVGSVRDQTHPAHEVFVAIDHNDALLERARRAFPAVRVVASDGAPGASGARNTAIRGATGDIVAFIDDDARADRHWLEAIARAHADPRVIGTCGQIVPRWEGPVPEWMPAELYWILGCSYRGLPTTTAPLRRAIAANMSLARDVLDAVGPFDERLGPLRRVSSRCEDTELGIRALSAHPGSVLLHVPDARVEHSVPPARTSVRYLVWRCWTEGRAKLLLKRAVGSSAGLADDRAYVAKVLPAAFVAALRDALRGDRYGVRRAGAIVAAFALTAAGYLYGAVAGPPNREVW